MSGAKFSLATANFFLVFSSFITIALVTSLPEPEVVGIVINGNLSAVIFSANSVLENEALIAFAVSIGLPPPTATKASILLFKRNLTPELTISIVGSGFTCQR